MKTTQTIKYILYARKSSESDDRQMASIEDQLSLMRKFARTNDLEIVDTITEAKSAKEPGRKGFNELIARISVGEANGILCWKINRLARNPVDGGQISWLLQRGIIKHIRTSTGDYYPTDNVIMMSVELGMANQYINDLRHDTQRGARQKAERGWNPQCILPIGYMHNPNRQLGENEIIEDPDRWRIANRMWRLLLDERLPVREIHRIAIDEWHLRNRRGNKYSLNTIHAMFRNEFYCGFFSWRQEDGSTKRYQGKHRQMISEEEFKKAQRILEEHSNRSTGRNRLRFPFRGPVQCGECECAITAEIKSHARCEKCSHKFSCRRTKNCPKCHQELNPSMVKSYVYYHCTRKSPKVKCKQGSVSDQNLGKQMNAHLRSLTLDEDFHDWAKIAFTWLALNEGIDDAALLDQLKRRLSELQKIQDKYAKRWAAELMAEDQFTRLNGEVNIELQKIEEKISEIPDNSLVWHLKAESYLNFGKNAAKRFREGTVERKKRILSALGSNYVLYAGKLFVFLPLSYEAIKNLNKRFRELSAGFEPPKDPDKQVRIAPYQLFYSSLLPELLEVRNAIMKEKPCEIIDLDDIWGEY